MAQEPGYRPSQAEVEKEGERANIKAISWGDDEEVVRPGDAELLITQLVLAHGQSNPR